MKTIDALRHLWDSREEMVLFVGTRKLKEALESRYRSKCDPHQVGEVGNSDLWAYGYTGWAEHETKPWEELCETP